MDGKLRTLQYNQTAEFTVGRSSGDNQLVFSTYEIDTYCEYTATYTISFEYGTISAEAHDFDGYGGLIGLNFIMESMNSHFNKTEASSTQAGDMIYLQLTLNATANENFDHAENFAAESGKAFVPTKCMVQDGQNNFTLFDVSGPQCSNDVIDLSINYDIAAKAWQIQHVLFLLNDKDSSEYTLTCDLIVCDMQKGEDCKAAYDCLIPSEEEEVCVPDPAHENKYTGNNCEEVVNSFAGDSNICTGSLAGPYVLGKDGRLWRDACCWKQWDLTKDCDF